MSLQNEEPNVIPTQHGFRKEKKQKKSSSLPKYALEKKPDKKNPIPKDSGSQGKSLKAMKNINKPLIKDKSISVSEIKNKTPPQTYDENIPKSKVKLKKPK